VSVQGQTDLTVAMCSLQGPAAFHVRLEHSIKKAIFFSRLLSQMLSLCALTFCYIACNPEMIQKEKKDLP